MTSKRPACAHMPCAWTLMAAAGVMFWSDRSDAVERAIAVPPPASNRASTPASPDDPAAPDDGASDHDPQVNVSALAGGESAVASAGLLDSYTYDDAGFMESHNGFDLTFDVLSRRTAPASAGTTVLAASVA